MGRGEGGGGEASEVLDNDVDGRIVEDRVQVGNPDTSSSSFFQTLLNQ